jgi:hypothetical protein
MFLKRNRIEARGIALPDLHKLAVLLFIIAEKEVQ